MSATPAELPRRFGFWTGLFVVAASMVGAAALTVSGPIAVKTGSNVALLWLWAVGGALSLAGALPMAEMATAYPRVGGDYVFIQKAFGPAMAFIYGWATVVCGFAAPIAAVAAVAADYVHPPAVALMGSDWSAFLPANVFVPWFAATLIVGFSLAHCSTHRQSAWVHNLATVFKLGVLVLFVLALAFAGRSDASNLWAASKEPLRLPVLGSSLVYVMYAYVGWNGAVYLAGEIRDPGRLLPRAVIGGCLAVTFLYLALNLGYGMAVRADELRRLPDEEVANIAKLIARLSFREPLAQAFSVAIGAGIAVSLSAFILSGARVVFAMARDGMFPAWAGQLSAVSHTPVPATVALGVLSLVCLVSGSFDALQYYAGFGLGLLASLAIVSIFRLRRRVDYVPAFQTPGYPYVPAVFVLVNTAMLIASAIDAPVAALVSVASIAAGFPLYLLCRPKSSG